MYQQNALLQMLGRMFPSQEEPAEPEQFMFMQQQFTPPEDYGLLPTSSSSELGVEPGYSGANQGSIGSMGGSTRKRPIDYDWSGGGHGDSREQMIDLFMPNGELVRKAGAWFDHLNPGGPAQSRGGVQGVHGTIM